MKKGSLVCIMIILIVCLLGFGGCDSAAGTGAGIGGLAGAGIGALTGGSTKSTLIGAAVGSGAGYMIGNEQDKKKARAQTNTAIAEANTFYVNVHNSDRSITPVRIVKNGNRYVAPDGREYFSLPTEEQLKKAGWGD